MSVTTPCAFWYTCRNFSCSSRSPMLRRMCDTATMRMSACSGNAISEPSAPARSSGACCKRTRLPMRAPSGKPSSTRGVSAAARPRLFATPRRYAYASFQPMSVPFERIICGGAVAQHPLEDHPQHPEHRAQEGQPGEGAQHGVAERVWRHGRRGDGGGTACAYAGADGIDAVPVFAAMAAVVAGVGGGAAGVAGVAGVVADVAAASIAVVAAIVGIDIRSAVIVRS